MARWIRTLAVVAVMGVALSACSKGDGTGVASLGGNETTATPTPSASNANDAESAEDAMLEFARCMRDHGVDIPDPEVVEGGDGEVGISLDGPAGGNVDEGEFREAQEACKEFLPEGGEGPDLSPEERARLQDAALQFARCMRDHGLDFPDPTFGDGPGFVIQQRGGSGIDPDDPKFREAEQDCRHFMTDALPEGAGGEGPTTEVRP